MRWRWRQWTTAPRASELPRREPPSPADDCAAFLDGRYARWLLAQGREVPGWAWLNQAAHAPHLDLLVVAVAQPVPVGPPAWASASRLVAQEVIGRVRSAEELDRLREEVLVPLELDLARTPLCPPLTPGQLVTLVRATLDADWAPVRR
jgi:hypothetical protein